MAKGTGFAGKHGEDLISWLAGFIRPLQTKMMLKMPWSQSLRSLKEERDAKHVPRVQVYSSERGNLCRYSLLEPM